MVKESKPRDIIDLDLHVAESLANELASLAQRLSGTEDTSFAKSPTPINPVDPPKLEVKVPAPDPKP